MKQTQNEILATTTKIVFTSLFVLPSLIGLSWGRHYSEEVYILLRYARNVANGNSLLYDPVAGFSPPPLSNPLFAVLISAFSKIGINPETAALILSISGWIVTGTAILLISRHIKWKTGGMTTVFLLSFNPFIIATLGDAHAWSLAMGWMSLASLIRDRTLSYIISITLFFGLTPDLLSPVLVMLLGIYEVWRKKKIPGNTAVATVAGMLLWAALGRWSNPWFELPDIVLIQAAFWTVLLFLSGIGAEWASAQLAERRLVNLPPQRVQLGLLGAVIISLGLAQGGELYDEFRHQPLAQWQVETDIATWLGAETPASTSLFASEKIGYLAERKVISPAAFKTPIDFQSLQNIIQNAPVNYLISPNVIVWQNLASAPWFRLSFVPVKRFDDPYAPATPYTIWAFHPPLEDWSERQVLNIQAPDRFDIVGYQFESQAVQPGENLQLALYFQTPEALIEPLLAFRALVRFVSPIDGSSSFEWEGQLPSVLEAVKWQPGQLITERFEIPIPAQLQIGAYEVIISFLDLNSDKMWVLSRDNDINPLDRFSLGFVSVPWHGTLDNVQPQTATVGESIKLLGSKLSEIHPGESLSVFLFWQVLQSTDEDYVVFVHVLDSAGELVANHDSIPLNGRYPTTAWQENNIIPDEHIFPLPNELPAGDYQIKVGMYSLATGERLTAADNNGAPLTDNAILLTHFTVP